MSVIAIPATSTAVRNIMLTTSRWGWWDCNTALFSVALAAGVKALVLFHIVLA